MIATPRVSIVVPFLRAEGTIERALASALAQSMSSLEVIAVSDGSTDGSGAIVDRFVERDRRVRFIRFVENRGPAHARNRAIEAARGEWITVLDADDAYEPGRLEALLAGAGDAMVVVDNLTGIDPADGRSSGPLFPVLPSALDVADIVAHEVSESRYNYGYLKPMFRRAFVDTHRLRYDETLRTAEDLVFLIECGLAGGPVRVVGDCGYRYTLQYSGTRKLSANTHSVPQDRDVAAALDRLVRRHGQAIDPVAARAIAARSAMLVCVADVSRFRYALHRHRYAAAVLLLRFATVRGYVRRTVRERMRSVASGTATTRVADR